MAAGYDQQDFVDVCNSVAGKPSIDHVEISNVAHPRQRVVVLDDDLIANLDARAERHNTDRVGYLRWVLTGKAPEETPAKPRRKKP